MCGWRGGQGASCNAKDLRTEIGRLAGCGKSGKVFPAYESMGKVPGIQQSRQMRIAYSDQRRGLGG